MKEWTNRIAFGIVTLGLSASAEHIATNSGPPIENAATRKTPQKPRKRPRVPSTRLEEITIFLSAPRYDLTMKARNERNAEY